MLVSYADIVTRLNALPNRVDGTYLIRMHGDGFSIYTRTENSGYEVGIQEWGEGRELHFGESLRFGIWTDESGTMCVDEVVHVESRALAVTIGGRFGQSHIWDWQRSEAQAVADFVGS